MTASVALRGVGFQSRVNDRGLFLRRFVRRNLWAAMQVLLVVITTVFFLMQSHCRMSLFGGESPSSVCQFLATKMKGSGASVETIERLGSQR